MLYSSLPSSSLLLVPRSIFSTTIPYQIKMAKTQATRYKQRAPETIVVQDKKKRDQATYVRTLIVI